MEDSTARRLAGAMEDLSARLNSGNMVEQLDEMNHNSNRLWKSIEDNNNKMDKYIESNEILAIEQQFNRATEQYISIQIAYKSKVFSAKEAGENLIMSFKSLQACYNRCSQQVKQKYSEQLKSIFNKYQELDKILLAQQKQDEDFKF